MIGIKGVGMTMLAQFLAAQKIEIIGSDTEEKFMTDEVLKRAGVKVIERFHENNVPADADLIIYSTAYNVERNVEVAKALNQNKIRVLTYAQALGEIFNEKYGIAVAGSHGKTTTTAWLAFVMQKSGLEPNAMVGSTVPQFEGPSITGNSDYLVVEADEYQNKLQYFNPKIALLNNIDYDHPDFFSSFLDYVDVFLKFIQKIPKKGFLVANFDDPVIRKYAGVNCVCEVVSYGVETHRGDSLKNYDFIAYDLNEEHGRQYFKVKMQNDENYEELGQFNITLPGVHNVYNALAVIAACVNLEIPLLSLRTSLAEFSGTKRRMEIMGEFNKAVIIDDYAHHPTEIKATLNGIRQMYPNNKLTVVFHPHTFTRTKVLLDDFAASFDRADEIIILDIYGSAREKQGGVHSRDLVEKIRTRKKDAKYISTLSECENYLRQNAGREEVILLMGAGDVFRVGENLIK